jgi:hypothetical protein
VAVLPAVAVGLSTPAKNTAKEEHTKMIIINKKNADKKKTKSSPATVSPSGW